MSGASAAAGPYSRRLCRDVCDATARRHIYIPPFLHDGTERPIQRPKDPEEPQEYDRGKKKCHTLKTLLVIHETCHMFFLSHTCAGKASDKRMAELAGST
jgi:hypothetical protein